MCQSGDVDQPLEPRRGVHHEAYDCWHRPGKERVPGPRNRRAWQGAREEATAPGPDGDVLREPPAVPDWYGSLWQRTSLGAQAPGDGPYRALDGTAVRQTVRQDQQERRS